MARTTQVEMLFRAILLGRLDQQWWRATDFQKEVHGILVGYEATARMSDIVRMYPNCFDVRKVGAYREIRFKFEIADELHRQLPHEMARHLVTCGIVR